MHPVHHYRIHLWDYEKAENALESAARCGQSAPSIAHMWHMPGHIYSRLKRYGDAAWQQEASARTDHAYMIRDRVMPDEIHNFAHNNEWLIRDLNYIGRAHDAVDLAKNMIELPRHPKYNTLSKNGSAKYGRMRLLESLQKFELFDELIALADTPYLEPTDDRGEQIKRLRALGAALVRTGEVDGALEQKENLIQLRDELQKARDEAVAKAQEKAQQEKKDKRAIDKAKSDARRGTERDLASLEKALQEIDGHLAVACGQVRNGLALLRKAGGVDSGYRALLDVEAGEEDKAEKSVRDQVRRRENQVLPLAALVEVLWRSGKTKEAGEEFARLRKLATQADLDVAPLARLAPLAAELNLPADWRIIESPPADVGNRPALDSLGPFRWHPYPAPSWTLKDAEGVPHALSDYHGRPVIVIFYLGHGCLHCAQQLEAFAPATEAFRKEGIDLVAISTDNREDLKISLANYKNGAFPFPLVSDAGLEVFKQYRSHDDFEQVPLHGTFLVDAAGQVRWQDISYEPFMDHQFLLKEARRLLAQGQDGPLVSARQEVSGDAAVH